MITDVTDTTITVNQPMHRLAVTNAPCATYRVSVAEGDGSFAHGPGAHAVGTHSVAFGENTRAAGYASLAEGSGSLPRTLIVAPTDDYQVYNILEGTIDDTSGTSLVVTSDHSRYVPMTGWSTLQIYTELSLNGIQSTGTTVYVYGDGAFGKYSHAEGKSSIAYGENSHAEGCNTIAQGEDSHAEG